MSGRAELVAAIDALATAGHSGDHQFVERMRREALALVTVTLPPPLLECASCGVRFSSAWRLAEHDFNIHDGPTPEHWLDQNADAPATGDGTSPDEIDQAGSSGASTA